MFLSPWFAIAGLAVAAGPIAIHLLNRRRFRVVEWAAMDFLRQAIRRSHRLLRLRDLLLLALRMACVVAFGLAMARPYFQATSSAIDPDQPVHAVLVVDNSLSMSYEQLDGTLLDEAKAAAETFIDSLPPGSRISVLPLCGALSLDSAAQFSLSAYGTSEDAQKALEAIEPVDRAASAAAAADLALEACRRVKSPPTKQVVFFSDQQASNWPAQSIEEHLDRLPAPMQVVPIRPDAAAGGAENAWVADFRLQDGIGDPATPAIFLATVRYQGRDPRHDVQVTLAVDGVTVATQTVELQPGQSREIRFPPFQFDVHTEPGPVAGDRATFVTAEVSIPHDRLPGDDQRFLVVPVVAALPVVFVDQYGSDEDPRNNRYGETFRLRRLLAPVTSRGEQKRQLIQVRHLKIDQLNREQLEDARLVVIAGVSDPGDMVHLLREYVVQGGNLVIAAGGRFDPAAWNKAAWHRGLGILPAPLKPKPVGRVPSQKRGQPTEPFQLDFATMVDDYFLLEQTSREELEDLYSLPYFFKAVVADTGSKTVDEMVRTAVGKIKKDRTDLAEINRRLVELTEARPAPIDKDSADKDSAEPADPDEQARLERARDHIQPRWLLWDRPDGQEQSDGTIDAEELARRTRPEVLAAFTNRVPFMIRRKVGRGRILFVSTGVGRDWNTLTTTNAVLVFDRIFRRLLEETLPIRNISTAGQLVVPVPEADRRARFTLKNPDGRREPISVDALGANRYGITVGNLSKRGFYRVAAYSPSEPGPAVSDAPLWEITLAVGGPAGESELDVLDKAGLMQRIGQADCRWIAPGHSISLAGMQIQGQDLWKWLMLAVLLGLLAELAILWKVES